MRGHIRRRYKNSWSVIIDREIVKDPETGRTIRKQKWITVTGTRDDAQKKLNEVLRGLDTNTYVDQSKMTVAEWLDTWFATAKTKFRAGTVVRYQGIIDNR